MYSASMESHQYPNYYIIQLDGYVYVRVPGQRHTGFESKTSFMSPGTMVHVIHMLFAVFAVFENLKAYIIFIRQHASTCHRRFH